MNEQDLIGDEAIRRALRSRFRLKEVDESDATVIIDELGLCRGQVRVDVAVVNGLLHGYEIKSDRDSLRRLAIQVEVYGKVLDRATLVIGHRRTAEALKMIPEWWGVLQVNSRAYGLQFKTLRRAQKNPHRDPYSLVELLWLDDAIALLEERKVARGVRGKSRRIVWNRVCEYFNVDEIAAVVRAKLKARATDQVLA